MSSLNIMAMDRASNVYIFGFLNSGTAHNWPPGFSTLNCLGAEMLRDVWNYYWDKRAQCEYDIMRITNLNQLTLCNLLQHRQGTSLSLPTERDCEAKLPTEWWRRSAFPPLMDFHFVFWLKVVCAILIECFVCGWLPCCHDALKCGLCFCWEGKP